MITGGTILSLKGTGQANQNPEKDCLYQHQYSLNLQMVTSDEKFITVAESV